jgi:hypothetical protein
VHSKFAVFGTSPSIFNPFQRRIFKIALRKAELGERVLLLTIYNIYRSISLDGIGLSYSVLEKEVRRRRNSKVAALFELNHKCKKHQD